MDPKHDDLPAHGLDHWSPGLLASVDEVDFTSRTISPPRLSLTDPIEAVTEADLGTPLLP